MQFRVAPPSGAASSSAEVAARFGRVRAGRGAPSGRAAGGGEGFSPLPAVAEIDVGGSLELLGLVLVAAGEGIGAGHGISAPAVEPDHGGAG